MKINICGIKVDNVSMIQAIEKIDQFISERRPSSVVTPNADHVVRYNRSSSFREIYNRADLVLADGIPLIWASKLLKKPLHEKISGSDLFPVLCHHSAKKNYGVFFIGGRPGAADRAAEILKKDNPRLKITGTYCPPFGFEKDKSEIDRIVELIREAAPDILFVGLGSPKQEIWIDKYKDLVNVPVSLGIGVSFEFMAGMVRRAPIWMQKVGLEWFWRVLMEPNRLWKRYIIDDSYFFVLLFKQLLRRKKNE